MVTLDKTVMDYARGVEYVTETIERGIPTADKARQLAGRLATVSGRGKRAVKHGERYTGHFTPYTVPGNDASANNWNAQLGGWYGVKGTADCGHEYTNVSAGNVVSISTGYGVDRDTDKSTCFECHAREAGAQLDALAAGERFYGYVSSNGDTLTIWPGNPLARVTAHWTYRGRWGSEMHCYSFSRNGRTFYGRSGGNGISIVVRAHKVQP